MTFPDRVEVLTKFGYTPRQAEFLVHAALHGGYFLRRQYHRFCAVINRGGPSNRLIAKLVERREVRVHSVGDLFVYHLCSRPFYACLGQEDNRNRRAKQPRVIRQRLMILDFVLDHLGCHFLPTEREKLDYFADKPTPLTVYRSRKGAPPTRRYFVDKNPIFIGTDGQPSFAFVDEGMATPDGFETWLLQYRALLESLATFRVEYVASTAMHFATAANRYRSAMTTFPDTDLGALVQHFQDRDLAERKEFHVLGNAGLDRLRNAKPTLPGAQLEGLYRLWKAIGPAAFLDRATVAQKQSKHRERAFGTYLLDHDYGLLSQCRPSPQRTGVFLSRDALWDGSGDTRSEGLTS